MGEAMIKGLLARGKGDAGAYHGQRPGCGTAQQVHADYGVRTTDDNAAAVRTADVAVLCVKPQMAGKVMATLHGLLQPGALALSIMAGVSIEAMTAAADHARIVRSIPNTPAQVGMGMTVWTATPEVTPQQRSQTADILGALGDELAVSEERYLDMATGLSGSGPGFVFLLIEADRRGRADWLAPRMRSGWRYRRLRAAWR